MMKKCSRLGLLAGLCLCACTPATPALNLTWQGSPTAICSDADGYYNYAASSILMDGVESHFYCSNKDPYSIVDHIALTQTLRGDGSQVSAKQIVLTPGSAAWEEQHDCDPSVVKGHFDYNGTTYQWAMFYLGEDFSPNVCMHNQIGVAFANSLAGPWVKYSGNPVVTFDSYDTWGVGQPCAFSLDKAGQLLLTYTRGDSNGTRILRQSLDFSDMSAPVMGTPAAVSKLGLDTGQAGLEAFLFNSSFMSDSQRELIYVVRPRRYSPQEVEGDVVEEELQVACMDRTAFLTTTNGVWTILGNMDMEQTGMPRNHNATFLRDPYGQLPELHRLTVVFCGAQVANLWTYRLFRMEATLSDPATVNTADFSKPYTPDADTVYLLHGDFDEGTDGLVPNAVAGGTHAWAPSVISDPDSDRFDTNVPASAFGTSIFFSGDDDWPRVDALVTQQAMLDSFENYENELTLEAWICPTSLGGIQRIISRANTHFLYLNGDEVECWLNFNDTSDASDAIALTTQGADLQADQWVHVAAIWDGTQLSIMLDEILVASQEFAGKGTLRRPTVSDWLVIGAAPWAGENFHGNIDEVRISKSARGGLVPVTLTQFNLS